MDESEGLDAGEPMLWWSTRHDRGAVVQYEKKG